ncbi:hypothetical protein HY625_01295 [Candidatus Uhrbacteria bacterium]|nr:hypothetical protein [Candidatus Uhrbacteria bacterium]
MTPQKGRFVMDRITVMDEQERNRLVREALLDSQLRALRKFALSPKHPERYDVVRARVQAIMQPKGAEKVRDLAEERRLEIEAFYKSLGFTITIPKLAQSNGQLNDLRKANQEPEYRPSDAEVPYDAFMVAVGQGNHWTVAEYRKYKAGETSTIGWEPCTHGYWFIADVAPQCPRTGTSWNSLTADTKIPLLSLEEYVITWHERKSKGVTLDIQTWCWLRTRWNKTGALRARGCGGRVRVCGHDAEVLARSWSGYGGRAAEMAKPAA